MSEAKQHQLRRGIRLTKTGASSTGHPYAGPIPPEAFQSISGGELRLETIAEPPIPFARETSLEAICLTLQTSGFEGIELPELQNREPVESAPVVSVPASPVPEPTPAIIIPKSTAPTNNVYEAIEFLDFDEPLYEYETEPEPEPEPEPAPPAMATDPLAVPVRFASPDPAKLMQGIAEVPMPAVPVQFPEIELRTLRRKMVLGSNPNKPAPKPEPVAASAPAPIPVAPPPPKPTPQVVVRSTPAPAPKQNTKPAPQQRPAVAAKSAPEPVKSAPAVEPKQASPIQEKPKVMVRPPESPRPAQAPPSKPVIAARDHGNAVPVHREPEPDPAPIPAPAPKPKLMPIRKPDAVAAVPAAVAEPVPMQGLSATSVSGGLSPVVKAAIAAVAVVVLGGGGYLAFSGSSAKANASSDIAADITAPGMVMGGGGWTTTWGSDAPHNKGKQIAIYRPSMAMTDYRFEFRGHIERKALGWIFRAAEPKNYYVMKLETIKPGPNPIVALVKYAVINGKETTHTQVLLPFENLALDTMYQVRFEARGDKFTTYIQNKLVDYWTDNRVKTGGAGFYNDNGERGQIKSSQVSYLIAGK